MQNLLHRTHLVGILFIVGLSLVFGFIFPLAASDGVILESLPVGANQACPGAANGTTVAATRSPKYDKKFHLLKGELEDYGEAKDTLLAETTALEPLANQCPFKVRYSLYL
jgi:hypothetical protein